MKKQILTLLTNQKSIIIIKKRNRLIDNETSNNEIVDIK